MVANWCQITESWTQGGVVMGNTLIFAFNAAQDTSHPFPYIRLDYFDTQNLRYEPSPSWDLWSPNWAYQYPSIAVNAHGELGGVFAWGGGTGAHHYWPDVGAFVLGGNGHIAWLPPLLGAGNACFFCNVGYAWGDYLTVRLRPPDNVLWEGTGFLFRDRDCRYGGVAETHNFVFGRPEDMSANGL